MFSRHSEAGYKPVLDGIEMKTLVHGPRTLMAQFRLAEGALLPDHSHPHEQTGYLVSGHLRLIVDGEPFETRAGDSWCIAGDVPHRAEALADTVAVEVFTPVREDYLP
jgi:quercetin dioxygenase-like cupin family protein